MGYPAYPKRNVQDLNGVWDFTFSDEFDFVCDDISNITYDDKIAVPSAFDALPAYNGVRGVGFYRQTLNIPANRKAKVRFGAVGMYCKVFVDGEKAAEHYSAYTAFECEIPASNNEKRELVVAACNRFDYETYCLHEIYFDFYAYGGIFRDVSLHILPEENVIDWVGVHTLDYQVGKICVTVESSGTTDLTMQVNDEEPVTFANQSFPNGRSSFELRVRDFVAWSPETPQLQTITVDNGTDAVTVRFGIREVGTEAGQVLLNGEPVKLLGYCRHEAHPQYGPALPLAQLVADLQLLRDLGCNFVRGSHYPQDARFLDLCDEMGFLVFEESMGWGQNAEKHFTDQRFVDAQLQQTREMIRDSYSHPCIIMRGFLNEGQTELESARPCYEALIKLIREEDPTMPVTYASNRELRDLFLEQVDIICFNIYPGWYAADVDDETPLIEINERIEKNLKGLQERGLADKPFILSEIGAGAIYGWRDPICAHWSEEYQDEYLKLVCERVVSDERIAGISLWQFCDCRTYRGATALKRPRAFNNKGTLDEYRRPKMAYNSIKDIFSTYNSEKQG